MPQERKIARTKKKIEPAVKTTNKKLVKLQPEKYFWLCDGESLKSLKKLTVALKKMDDDVFNHHVREERNDFALWAKDVFGEKSLANDLEKAKTIETTLKVLKIHGF